MNPSPANLMNPRVAVSWLVFCGVFASVFGARAAASDWTYVDFAGGSVPLSAAHAAATADGYWLFGGVNAESAALRADLGGRARAARRVTEASDGQAFGLDALALGDGGAIVLRLSPSGFPELSLCGLVRLRADGSVLWRRSVGMWPGDCGILGRDANDAVWIRAENIVVRFVPDGTAITTADYSAELTGPATRRIVPVGSVDAASGILYAAASDGPGHVAAITAFKPDGTHTQLWHAADNQTEIAFLLFAGDGNLYALGKRATPYVFSVTKTGTLRWEKALAGDADFVDAAAFAAGGVVAIDGLNVYALAGNGDVRYARQVDVPACDACVPGFGSPRVAALPDGEALVLLAYYSELVRLDAHGDARWGVAPGKLVGASQLLQLADGTALVGPVQTQPGSDAVGYVRFAATGATLPTVHDAFAQSDPPLESVHADDGTLYVLSSNGPLGVGFADDNPAFRLRKITPAGQAAWKIELGAAHQMGSLQLGFDRVCYGVYANSPTARIECRALADGALLWSTPVPASPLALLDDGTVIALAGGYPDGTLYALGADGAITHQTHLPFAFENRYDEVTIGANGTVVISSLHDGGGVYAYDRNGNSAYTLHDPFGTAPAVDGQTFVLDDGSALLMPSVGSRYEAIIWRLDAKGRELWRRPMPEYVPRIAKAENGIVQVLAGAPGGRDTLLIRLSLVDGSEISRITLRDADLGRIEFDHATGLILAAQVMNADVVRVRVIDPDSGTLLRDVVQSCDARCQIYPLFDAALGSDGTLRTVMGEIDAAGTAHVRADGTLRALLPAPLVRIDQPGLDGAWYATYEGGQGFALDYIAAARMIFMPWFTYKQDGFPVPDPAYLAWYTLQGVVDEGATGVDLAIAQTAAGAFDSGSVGSSQTGSAHLQFTDCNNGLLFYQVDRFVDFGNGNVVNEGQGGIIVLSRLTPSTGPCVLADGSASPAQIANAPAQGFDARQSGSWFDPDTSGQGLQITVIPAGNGFDGLLFAPWFTFDPSGHADDPQHQHWFTLQGSLAHASNGVAADLPILRTIGAELDAYATGDTFVVGHATLTMLGCDRARLDYRFEQTEVVHAFAGLAGRSNLVKLGGCNP